jgi:hypothetical protein
MDTRSTHNNKIRKSTYQNSGVCVDAYDATGKDKNMYYGQIQEILLFHCNWVDGIKHVCLTFTVSRFFFSVATGLIESSMLYKTNTVH